MPGAKALYAMVKMFNNTGKKHQDNGVPCSQVATNSTSNMFQRGQDFRLEFQWSS